MKRDEIIKALKLIEIAADEYCKREDCPAKWLTSLELDEAIRLDGLRFSYEISSGCGCCSDETDYLTIPWSWFEDVEGRADEIEAARATAAIEQARKAEAARLERERKDAEAAKRKEAEERATLRRLAAKYTDELL